LNIQRINNIFEVMAQVKNNSIGFAEILKSSVRPIEERFAKINVEDV
jgi:hypothetical protein